MVKSIMDIKSKIAAYGPTTSESDIEMDDASLEENVAPQHGYQFAANTFDHSNVHTNIAMSGNIGAQATVSPDSHKSHPSTPDPNSSFWVPGIENMQLFNFDFDNMSSSPSSNRSLSPSRSSSPTTHQGVQTHPCPPMSKDFKFNFPSAKEKETETTPNPVGRRIATPKSKKKSAAKSKPDITNDEVIDDKANDDETASNDEATTYSRSTSSSTLISDDDQTLGDIIIGEKEDSRLVAAFTKMIGITNTRDLNLKHEMRLKVEALMNELIEMERDANTPEVEDVDQQETSTNE
jgi:hypothetical protein